jgi:hypothetical protein
MSRGGRFAATFGRRVELTLRHDEDGFFPSFLRFVVFSPTVHTIHSRGEETIWVSTKSGGCIQTPKYQPLSCYGSCSRPERTPREAGDDHC